MISYKPIQDVTEEDLDGRFASGHWTKVGGNLQSMTFYQAALHNLEKSSHATLFDMLRKGVYSLHDYGCAEGDGTALLQATFPLAQIVGFDLSHEAVARASARWPTVAFAHGDINNPQHTANVIWTSHTIEHLPDPAATVRGLLQRCRWLVVLVPPIPEDDVSEAHSGAVGVNTWINSLGFFPLYHSYLLTERRDTENKSLLLEESLLLFYQGFRAW